MAARTFGTVSPEQFKAMNALAFVQGLASGVLPLNTIARILGYEVVEADPGRVVIAAQPTQEHLNPWGTVHGGLTATLLDSCMGLAVQTMLENGIGSTTLEFKVSLIRPYHAANRSDSRGGHAFELRPACRHRGRPRHRPGRALARARHDLLPHFSALSRPLPA